MDNKKQEVIEFSKRLNSTNLSPLRSGNISVRTQIDGEDGFYITPSGIKYENLKEEDIVFLSNEKEYDFLKIFNSGLNPSSEWRFHQDIYKNKREAKAIVHTHSTHATAISTHRKSIPPFHYMIALIGGEDIRCAEYATFGTKELSMNIIKALENRKACLMANHGALVVGNSITQAQQRLEELEFLAKTFLLGNIGADPKLLSAQQMSEAVEAFSRYQTHK